MKKIILICFLLLSCAKTSKDQVMIKDIDFDKDLSFDEYKSLIIEYGKKSGYPDIKN